MGEYQVVFSEPAQRDLEKIVRYVTRHDPAAAERIGFQLIDRSLILAKEGCALMGSTLSKRPNIRKLVQGNYLILYRVFLDRDKIRILRFWHAARDPDRLNPYR